MSHQIELQNERQIQRIMRLVQNEINTLTGQLVIATQDLMRPKLPGSRRERAEKAVKAIPGQIEDMKAVKDSLRLALRECERSRG